MVAEAKPVHTWLFPRVSLRGDTQEGESMLFNDLYRQIRYRRDNPLRLHHVPRRRRLDVDPPRVPTDSGDADDLDSRRAPSASEEGVG